MNLLQVTPTDVHPPESGGDHRRHGLLAAPVREGDDVRRYVQAPPPSQFLAGPRGRTVDVDEGYAEIRPANVLDALLRGVALVGIHAVPLLGRRLQWRVPDRLDELVSWADVVLVEGPYQVPGVAAAADATPVVYSAHNVEADLFESGRRRLLRKTVERQERAALRVADLVVCTTERDARSFRERYDFATPTAVVENGVPAEALETDPATAERARELRAALGLGEDTVGVFVGSAHPPNVEAVELLYEQAPDLDGVEVLVVGRVCGELDDPPGGITLPGFVDDVDPYLELADVGLNPVLGGSGSNVKVFEYCAHGLPVLTTPFGVRGIELVDGSTAVLAPAEEFGTVLAETDWSATATGEHCRDLVERRYTWPSLSARLRERLLALV